MAFNESPLHAEARENINDFKVKDPRGQTLGTTGPGFQKTCLAHWVRPGGPLQSEQ